MERASKILFALILILTMVLWVNFLMGPVDRSSSTVIELKIEPGTSSSQIGQLLYNHQLIKSRFVFNTILKVRGLDQQLKAGYYALRPSAHLNRIIKQLVEGEVATFQITIPEGFTVEEIAKRLAELTAYTSEDFLAEARHNLFAKPYLRTEGIGNRYTVEGFLYPNTYIIPKEYSPQQILQVMLDEFEERWWERLKDETDRMSFTPYQIMIVASLIEAEAKLKEERPLIAAVIYRRLNNNMLLQLDASVQYSLPARKSRVLYRDLDVESLYNTYRYPGLPPGPVCSPGDSSIEAALAPAETDYLFYFARKDGSHVFSKTYQEHLRKQNELREQ